MTRRVFSGGQVFDGTGSPAAAGGRRCRGRPDRRGRAPGSTATRRSTAPAATVLPGLFDCHVHVMISGVDLLRHAADAVLATASTRRRRTCGATLGAGHHARCGTPAAPTSACRGACERGLIAGPRMQISITMLSQTGGHGDGWHAVRRRRAALRRRTRAARRRSSTAPTRCAARCASCVRAGADVIKVATSGGVLSPRDDPRHGHFRAAELDVLVEEATAAGRLRDGPRPGRRRASRPRSAPASARSSTASTSTTRRSS